MAGLLYKDFVAVHGKLHVAVLLGITVFLALFSISPLPAAADYGGALIAGIMVGMAAFTFPLMVSAAIESSVISVDEGAKKKAYLMSLPVSKRQYVASKYLFILISYYVVLSATAIWAQFVNIHMSGVVEENIFLDIIGLTPLWIQVLLIVSALELPFLISVGVRAGNAIKTGILAVILYAMFAYMLFGDVTLLDEINLIAMVEWLKEHEEITLTLQVLGPVIAGGFYYLSYRITASIYERREQENEE